jgi:hypothetical protein
MIVVYRIEEEWLYGMNDMTLMDGSKQESVANASGGRLNMTTRPERDQAFV